MIKNLYLTQIFILIVLISILNSDAKQIQDPVARHDANMCGTYLCPGLPDLATKYLESGCEEEFKIFLNNEIYNKEKELNNLELFVNNNSNDNYTKLSLIIIAILSGLLSSTCGYYIGKWEGKKYKKINYGVDEF